MYVMLIFVDKSLLMNIFSRHAYHNREGEMWDISNCRSVKGDSIFVEFARFYATSHLSDIFVSKFEELLI